MSSEKGKTLDIDLVYYHIPKKAGISEKDNCLKKIQRSIPVETAALVLVDVWNNGYNATHLERSENITESKIKPLMAVFRQTGIQVIHAPCPETAKKYPDWLLPEIDVKEAASSIRDEEWPPSDFVHKGGDYKKWARPPQQDDPEFHKLIKDRKISDNALPQGNNVVIATGEELHQFLKSKKILHLFYAGYATNICILRRDYGVRAMQSRGYEIILIEDCTTGIEVNETYEGFGLTQAAIVEVQWKIGYTITASELMSACCTDIG